MPRFPWIEFTLTVGAWEYGDEAYPDTGFEGGLIIPVGVGREIIAASAAMPWRLVDGSIRKAKTWSGTVMLDSHSFRTDVVAIGSRCLLGREILDELEICFQFGKTVRLRFADDDAP